MCALKFKILLIKSVKFSLKDVNPFCRDMGFTQNKSIWIWIQIFWGIIDERHVLIVITGAVVENQLKLSVKVLDVTSLTWVV